MVPNCTIPAQCLPRSGALGEGVTCTKHPREGKRLIAAAIRVLVILLMFVLDPLHPFLSRFRRGTVSFLYRPSSGSGSIDVTVFTLVF